MSRNSQAHGFMGLMESWSWIQDLQSLYRPFFSFEKVWTKCSSNFTSVWHSFRKSMRFKKLWLVFDKNFSNGKIRYVTIVDLAEMIKLGIQSFFIWGHLVSHLSKFDQVKFGQIKKQHFDSSIMSCNDFKLKSFEYQVY